MNAVETIIMQTALKAVKDYNNAIEMLDPGVKKYFENNHDTTWNEFIGWVFDNDGLNISITYAYHDIYNEYEYDADIVPLETIVKIAVELSFNK